MGPRDIQSNHQVLKSLPFLKTEEIPVLEEAVVPNSCNLLLFGTSDLQTPGHRLETSTKPGLKTIAVKPASSGEVFG